MSAAAMMLLTGLLIPSGHGAQALDSVSPSSPDDTPYLPGTQATHAVGSVNPVRYCPASHSSHPTSSLARAPR